MLTGKWWLRPDGAALNVSDTEHALVARRVMLGLKPDANRFSQRVMFAALTPEEQTEFRKAGKSILSFLREENDPRVFAIRQWRWVRVRKDRFYLWKFDVATLRIIRASRDYWSQQVSLASGDCIDVIELSTGDEFSLPVRCLRAATAKASSLKNSARRALMPRRQR